MTVGIACLLFIQNSIVKDDMELQAYEKLLQEIRQVRWSLNYDKSDTPSIGREYYDRYEDVEDDDKLYMFLQSIKGDYIAGEVPDGYNEKLSLQSDLDIKSFNGVKYYILTRKARVGKKNIGNNKFMICAMVSVKDIKANYRILWYRTYTVIGVVALFFFVFAVGLRKLVTVPMKELNVAIDKSSQNLDFTEKLRYDGPFLELDMITESNNNLYDRVRREFERQEEFNANVSHELRTPVAVMHAQCQLSREIAEKNNVELRDCYTGFKWIAREIAISEGKQQYIGGGEESFGFLPYDKVRDKDAPASICLICEIAAWAKDQGKTLYDLLMQIYAEYGFSKEFTVNVVRPGKTGADEIKQMMTDFRANPPKELGGSKIVTWKDYQSLEAKHADGSVEKLNMPTTSNVLQWFCDDNTKVSVRPSGTEPKIKFYIEVKDPSFKCAGCYNRCTAAAMEKIEAIKKSLNLD